MTAPHRCPVCDGRGVDPFVPEATAIPTRVSHPCHACRGQGIVWEPEVKPPLYEKTEPYTSSAPVRPWFPFSTGSIPLAPGDVWFGDVSQIPLAFDVGEFQMQTERTEDGIRVRAIMPFRVG